jgi:hypothetical protein
MLLLLNPRVFEPKIRSSIGQFTVPLATANENISSARPKRRVWISETLIYQFATLTTCLTTMPCDVFMFATNCYTTSKIHFSFNLIPKIMPIFASCP